MSRPLEQKAEMPPVDSSDACAARFLRQTLVVIPALNEAESVAETVRSWLALGVGGVRVVDNGSIDDTTGRSAEAGAEIMHEPACGYGAAAWRGLQDWPSECDWVLFSSADGSDWLSSTQAVSWQHAVDSGAELVLGNRTALTCARKSLKLTQRFGNWLCCVAIERGWGWRFRDIGSLRLVRRAVFEPMQLRDRSFGWNVEMQVRALEVGLRVVELPVNYFPRRAGESKISGSLIGTVRAGSSILGMLAHLWRLRCKRDATLADGLAPQPN